MTDEDSMIHLSTRGTWCDFVQESTWHRLGGRGGIQTRISNGMLSSVGTVGHQRS